MTIVIRRGQPEDWPAIVDFNCKMARETEGINLDTAKVTSGVQAVMADGQMGFDVIAEASNDETTTIAGALMVTQEWSDWRNGLFWWIQSNSAIHSVYCKHLPEVILKSWWLYIEKSCCIIAIETS